MLHKLIIAGLLSLIACISLYVSNNKILWYDELLTLHLSRIPDLPTFWSALATGPDCSPPLYDFCVRQLLPLLGEEPAVLRLPALLGYIIMSYCIFKFVNLKYGFYQGCVGMLIPAITSGFKYSWEARPYGLLMGLTGILMVSWQKACEGTRRRLPILGLALGLAGAIWTHHYGVMVVLPIIIGELARVAVRRKIDWTIGGTIVLCLSTLPLMAPLIAHARSRSDTFYSKPELIQMVTFYAWLFHASLLPIIVCVAIAFLAGSSPRGLASRGSISREFGIHERCAVVGLALLPVIEIVISKLATGAFVFRYAVPSLFGLGALAGALTGKSSRSVCIAFLLVLSAWIAAEGTKVLDPRYAKGGADQTTYQRLSGLEDRLPIVVADPTRLLQVDHYALPSVAKRLYWLNTGKTDMESYINRELISLCEWHPLNISRLREFADLNPEFYLLGLPAHPFVLALKEEFPEASVRVLEGEILHVRLGGQAGDVPRGPVEHPAEARAGPLGR